MDTKLQKITVSYCVWAIGGLVFLSALTKIRLLLGLFNFQEFWQQALVTVFFGSAVCGLVGLFRHRMWGFISVYVYIAIATFLLSVPAIPIPLGSLGLEMKASTTFLLVINFAVLAITAFLHTAKWKENRKQKGTS